VLYGRESAQPTVKLVAHDRQLTLELRNNAVRVLLFCRKAKRKKERVCFFSRKAKGKQTTAFVSFVERRKENKQQRLFL
jgi:hypothetical protein